MYDVDSCLLKSLDLIKGTTLSTRDDSTGVTHSAAWGSSLSGNERKNWEFSCVILREPVSSFLFSFTTDFTYHNDTMSLWVFYKALEHIDEVGAVERITTNADNGGLTEPNSCSLVNCFIG
jgi:hypothetical protein